MKNALILFTLVALGCTHSDPRASTDSVPQPAGYGATLRNGSPQTPLTVEWVVRDAGRTRTVLVARVTRHAPVRVPVNVTVTLPPGTRLVSGVTQFTIPPSDAASVHDQELIIESSGQPASDAVLEADASGVGFGMHAKDSYSFGRPKKHDPVPTPEGPSVKLGTHDIGPAIPAK